MGYRIRYEKKKLPGRMWWLAAVPVLVGTLVYGDRWYTVLARYVGVCIRGR